MSFRLSYKVAPLVNGLKPCYGLVVIFALFALHFPHLLRGFQITSADLLLYHPPFNTLLEATKLDRSYASLSDAMDFSLPRSFFIYESILDGVIPLYSTLSLLGSRLMLNGVDEFSHPIYLLTLILFGPRDFTSALILSKIAIGYFSFFFLMRKLGLRNSSATIGAVTFCCNSYAVSNFHNGLMNHYISVPLLILSLLIIKEKHSLKNVALLLVGLLSMILGGYPPALTYYLPFIAFVFLVLAFQTRRQFLTLSLRLFTTLLGIFIFLLPIFLHMWKSIDLVDKSYRTSYSQQILTEGTLVSVFSPFALGENSAVSSIGTFSWVRHSLYVGVLPAIFAIYFIIINLIYFRSQSTLNKMMVSYFFVLLLLVSVPLLNQEIYARIPLLNLSYANNQISVLAICLSIFSSFGFEFFMHRNFRLRTLYLISISTVIVAFLLWIRSNSETLKEETHFQFALLLLSIVALVPTILSGRLSSIVNGVAQTSSFASALLVLIVCLDLFRQVPFIHWETSTKSIYPETVTTDFLIKNTAVGDRVLPLGTSLLADSNYAFGLEMVAGRGFPTTSQKIAYSMVVREPWIAHPTQDLYEPERLVLNRFTFQLLNIKYLVLPNSMTSNSEFSMALREFGIATEPIILEGLSIYEISDSHPSVSILGPNCLSETTFRIQFHEPLIDSCIESSFTRPLTRLSLNDLGGFKTSDFATNSKVRAKSFVVTPYAFDESLTLCKSNSIEVCVSAVDINGLAGFALRQLESHSSYTIHFKPSEFSRSFLLVTTFSGIFLMYFFPIILSRGRKVQYYND